MKCVDVDHAFDLGRPAGISVARDCHPSSFVFKRGVSYSITAIQNNL